VQTRDCKSDGKPLHRGEARAAQLRKIGDKAQATEGNVPEHLLPFGGDQGEHALAQEVDQISLVRAVEGQAIEVVDSGGLCGELLLDG